MINLDLSTLPSDDEQLIKQGFSLSGSKTIEVFAIQAMINESTRLHQDANNTTLTTEAYERFVKACEHPGEPNEKLKNAFKRCNTFTK
ncbi:MAG: DUF1778 domain-containing protein [Oceanospirillaceae bacterium]|nr:DUF1778 domain-containing protein [Oceanospirillaceae bacterium]